MENDGNIKRYSASELRERRARGESKTNLALVKAQITDDAALDAQLAEDGFPADWHQDAQAVRPENKKLISLRLDAEVIEWFRSQGPGYQTRINAVLKSFIDHAGKTARSSGAAEAPR